MDWCGEENRKLFWSFLGFNGNIFIKYLILLENGISARDSVVPSLQCLRSDPLGVRRWGILSPSCSPSMGTPLLQQIALRNNGIPLKKVRKLRKLFH
jgi:hypothetical protein